MVQATDPQPRDSGTYACRSGDLAKEIRVIVIGELGVWAEYRAISFFYGFSLGESALIQGTF